MGDDDAIPHMLSCAISKSGKRNFRNIVTVRNITTSIFFGLHLLYPQYLEAEYKIY